MTLLSSQTPSLEPSSAAAESAEQRMLEKRAKVIEELLQTERDYIRDLEMCVERIMVPLQQAQVGAGKGEGTVVQRWWIGARILSPRSSQRRDYAAQEPIEEIKAVPRGGRWFPQFPALVTISPCALRSW